MAWPFAWFLRPIVRAAAWFLGHGWSEERTQSQLEAPPHYHAAADVEAAIPEAERALYFADFLRARPGAASFGSAWFAAARGAWYAAYGRAPTAEEREWAFTRPQGQLGVYVLVSGQGAWSGEIQHRTIKVNASWNSSYADVAAAVRALVESNQIHLLRNTSEPFTAGSITVEIERGALLEFVDPLLTV